MMAAHPFASFFEARTARSRLEPAVRRIWGDGVDLESCEVLHVWRKTHVRESSARKSFALISFRLGLHDRVTEDWSSALAHGLVRFDGDEVCLDLRPFPEDAALPQLASLTAVEHVLRDAPGSVQEYCGADRPDRIDVVNYRPGLRCTLRIAARRTAYAKTFVDDAGAILAGRLQALSQQFAASGNAPTVPSVLDYDAATRTVWFAEVESLHPFLPRPARRWTSRASWESLGLSLAALHRARLPGLVGLSRDHRLGEVGKKVAKLEAVAPGLGARARAVLEWCATRAAQLPPARMVLLHGDLHVGQLGQRDGAAVLFDFDELAAGPAAHDFASLRVDLENQGVFREPVSRALARVFAGYVNAGECAPEPAELDWHYRLQWLDRAYRDWWRHDVAALGRIRRALLRAEGGLAGGSSRGGA